MAIQYYMRGYNLGLPGDIGYVDWVVNDVPDSTATYVPAPYNPANITNITVNKTVTSKVDNFLKPFESLTAIGGTGNDGYFFHLNSYDWLHTTPPGPPIPVPSYLVGLSVVRGSSDGVTPRDYATLFWAEDALKWLFAYNTNGDGISIGSALPVGMGSLSVDGYIEVGTNPAQSGIIRIPNNQFIVSRNATNSGDAFLIGQDNLNRVILGSSPSNQIYIPGDLRVDGYIRDGGIPSLSGFIRNSNATSIITFRNVTNTSDVLALSSTSGNLIVLGDAVNFGTRFNTADGYEHIFQVDSDNLIRIGNIGGTTYANFENVVPNPIVSQFDATIGNGQNLTFKAQNTSSIGGIGGSTIISSGHGLSADGYVDLRVNNVPKIRVFGATVPVTADLPDNSGSNPNSIQLINNTVRWYDTVSNPTIIQDQTNLNINAEPMFIKAQRANAATRIGGDLRLSSGGGNAVAENTPASSHSLDGYVRLQTGTVDRLFIDATANRITETLSIFAFNGLDGTFDAASVTNPIIRQRNDITDSITGQLMTIQSQNTTGINAIGGSLNITSGQGTLADGYVRLQTGGTTKLLIDSFNNQIIIGEVGDTTYIPGTLFIGTFNSSTDLLVEDRLIHTNFNEAVVGPPVPPPVLITGLTVHRGDDGALTYNDEAGWVWVEGANLDASDGYWKAASVADGDDLNLLTSLNIMGRSLSITNNPNITTGLPAIGGLRTLNNSVAVSSRNATDTQDLLLLGTDSFNHIILGAITSPFNTGFVFNTSLGSVYDFQVNSISNKIQIGDGYIRSGSNPSIVGIFRNSQVSTIATDIITSRDFGNTLNLKLLGTDGYDRITHGNDTFNKGHIFNTADTTIDGYGYDFKVNSISSATIDGYKFSYKVGRRRHITAVSTTYNVLDTDDFLAINASSVYTITLPTSPTLGDTYEFKDVNGAAAVNNITIDGTINNIDGISTLVINTNFAALVVTYTGTQWSVS